MVQQRLCEVLRAPERVSYAPGPSFRKLLERLDGNDTGAVEADASGAHSTGVRAGIREDLPREDLRGQRSRPSPRRGWRIASRSLWRPPGLAWAASFIAMVGITALVSSAYRWSEPRYTTRTDAVQERQQDVLHVALDRDLTIGEVEALLRTDGARVVEGPDASGIFGISPVRDAAPAPGSGAARAHSAHTRRGMRELAARLRADPRVRWVEPIDSATESGDPADAAAPQGRER